jgi:type II secretory pathway component PulK
MKRRQSGVAMVLVLALTIVLGMLVLQFSLTAKSQVEQSRVLIDRARAELQLHSLESALLFDLLTEPRVLSSAPDDSSWNFAGVPFRRGEHLVRLQDTSGLFALPEPDAPTADFERLLETLGVDEDRARDAGRALYGAQRDPVSFPLQTFRELQTATGLDQSVIEQLEEIATFYPAVVFNPATAPEQVLAARYGSRVASTLVKRRAEGGFNEDDLQRITGREMDLLTSLLVGPGFRLDLSVQVGDVRLARRSVWTVYPSAEDNPLSLWSRQRVDPQVIPK